MSTMTIAKFADAGGVGVETVRYYQRRGLLNEPARPGGGIRRYGENEIRRLRFIRQAQTAGFTLNEIERLLAFHATDDRPQVLELACSRIAALDAQSLQCRQHVMHLVDSQMTAALDHIVRAQSSKRLTTPDAEPSNCPRRRRSAFMTRWSLEHIDSDGKALETDELDR
jgi:MerR family mercuric resistance operon transcriptional regulator